MGHVQECPLISAVVGAPSDWGRCDEPSRDAVQAQANVKQSYHQQIPVPWPAPPGATRRDPLRPHSHADWTHRRKCGICFHTHSTSRLQNLVILRDIGRRMKDTARTWTSAPPLERTKGQAHLTISLTSSYTHASTQLPRQSSIHPFQSTTLNAFAHSTIIDAPPWHPSSR
jgi:hypothetical protein